MAAMHRTTGKRIEGLEEIEQSVDEILETIPGDRVMRADYGSELYTLTDVGMDASGKTRIYQAVAGALRKFEPRLKISRVTVEGEPGEVTQTLYGTVLTTNEQVKIRR